MKRQLYSSNTSLRCASNSLPLKVYKTFVPLSDKGFLEDFRSNEWAAFVRGSKFCDGIVGFHSRIPVMLFLNIKISIDWIFILLYRVIYCGWYLRRWQKMEPKIVLKILLTKPVMLYRSEIFQDRLRCRFLYYFPIHRLLRLYFFIIHAYTYFHSFRWNWLFLVILVDKYLKFNFYYSTIAPRELKST